MGAGSVLQCAGSANRLCSARAPGTPDDVRRAAESVIVFATDPETQAALEA